MVIDYGQACSDFGPFGQFKNGINKVIDLSKKHISKPLILRTAGAFLDGFPLNKNVDVAKRGGLFHDIGKALDQQIQGSHIEIGIKILEKYGESEAVIHAMRSHHNDYPADTLEAVIVTVADSISGSRPGARKDTLEN
ncbi:MAG: uncharacterized protein CEO22_553, partial [Candidatus Berkelbacteria bacterium Gr01-1014_85]